MASKPRDNKVLQVVSVTSMLVLAAILMIVVATGGGDVKLPWRKPEPGTLEAVDSLPEEATREEPVSISSDVELPVNSTRTFAASYYNIGFPQCENPGARVRMTNSDDDDNITYQSRIVKISYDNASYIPYTITNNEDPGPYRASFEIVCDDVTVAKSSTSVVITRD